MKEQKRIVVLLFFLTIFSCQKKNEYHFIRGNALGTTFSVKYEDALYRDFSTSIDSLFGIMNRSLSTYHPNSLLSKINKGDSLVIVDTHFTRVFRQSQKVFVETQGAFDPTVGILVNAWGFGPEKKHEKMDSIRIKNLMQLIGFEKVTLAGNKVHKKHPDIYLDFNAIAKGYTVDVIGVFLESKKIKNYMVEIGGEVRTRGVNPQGKSWQIGVEKPSFNTSRELESVLDIRDKSMATSGNYRKYKIDVEGRKFVHTIDPKTGYTLQNDLLSATVISKLDCAYTDAYATAFMVMGFEKTKAFLKDHQELEVFLIYIDAKGKTRVFNSLQKSDGQDKKEEK